MLDVLKAILIMQAFFSISVTALAYSLPADTLNYVYIFKDEADRYNLQSISEEMQEGLTQQTKMPIIELGSLIFYSGNLIVDLLLNFAFAIPAMFGLLINGLSILLNIDAVLFMYVQLFTTVLITVIYLLGIVQTLINLRGRGTLV